MWELLSSLVSKTGGELLSCSVSKVVDLLAGSLWRGCRRGRVHLERQKRRIREIRIVNRIYPELHRLREILLRYNLLDKRRGNREFFDKWLSDYRVEMCWESAGGWPAERVLALRRDLADLKA